MAKLILVLAAFGLGLDFLFHNVRFSDGRLSGIPWFTAAAVILVVAQSLRAYFAGADLVLGALGAHPFFSDDQKNQVVIDVVREMALAPRIPEPRIDVIDDPSPNAFAIGRDSEHSAICVTQGLLEQMERRATWCANRSTLVAAMHAVTRNGPLTQAASHGRPFTPSARARCTATISCRVGL